MSRITLCCSGWGRNPYENNLENTLSMLEGTRTGHLSFIVQLFDNFHEQYVYKGRESYGTEKFATIFYCRSFPNGESVFPFPQIREDLPNHQNHVFAFQKFGVLQIAIFPLLFSVNPRTSVDFPVSWKLPGNFHTKHMGILWTGTELELGLWLRLQNTSWIGEMMLKISSDFSKLRREWSDLELNFASNRLNLWKITGKYGTQGGWHWLSAKAYLG